MSIVNSIYSSARPIMAATAVSNSASSTAPVPDAGTSREDMLGKQLNERLSSEISSIRRQMSMLNQPDPNSADGSGRTLNIGA